MKTIEKSTYVEADEKTRHALTYDLIIGLHQKFDEQVENCNGRICKLENNKRKNSAISGMFGFLGGFVAMAAYWLKEKL